MAQPAGRFGNGRHLSCFGEIDNSFFRDSKVVITGQSAALITDDELADKIRELHDFGHDKDGSDHYLCKERNFEFSDLQTVGGFGNMKKLPRRIEQ